MMEDLKIYITITVIIQLCIVLCIANDGENIPSIRRSNIQSFIVKINYVLKMGSILNNY